MPGLKGRTLFGKHLKGPKTESDWSKEALSPMVMVGFLEWDQHGIMYLTHFESEN